jgi:glycosyltransferase involved in cell wall biosynthesis
MTELSVVMICRNQEWNVPRLVESVLRETDPLLAGEIVLVDSASTDRTTEVAAHYPITVLKLDADQRLTAAAGRFVGYKRTTGDLVLFLDGDMELCEGWLRQALGVMQSSPNVAAVCGQVIDRPLETETGTVERREAPGADAPGVDVRHGGGAAMYRRSVLEQVGTFNPYLYSDEEPELCLRIRHAGYRVLRLMRPIVFHYTAPLDAFSTLLGKRGRKFFLGFGQNIRYFFGGPVFWIYLKERGFALAPALVFGIGVVAAAASMLTGRWLLLVLWAICLILLTMGIAIRKRSLQRALYTLFLRLLILDGTVRGLLLEPYNPAGYPGKYSVVRRTNGT